MARRRIKRVALTGNANINANSANDGVIFAFENPEDEAVIVMRVLVEATTAPGVTNGAIDIGIADDAIGTSNGDEFSDGDTFAGAAVIIDSMNSTNTEYHGVINAADAAADAWIVGKFSAGDANSNAAALVGNAYIEYLMRYPV